MRNTTNIFNHEHIYCHRCKRYFTCQFHPLTNGHDCGIEKHRRGGEGYCPCPNCFPSFGCKLIKYEVEYKKEKEKKLPEKVEFT